MGTLTGTYTLPDGTPETGALTFRLTARVIDAEAPQVRTEGPVTAYLDQTGAFTVELVPTDAPEIAADGLCYEITEHVGSRPTRVYYAELLTADAPWRIEAVAVYDQPLPTVLRYEMGETGPPGPQGDPGPPGPQGEQGIPGVPGGVDAYRYIYQGSDAGSDPGAGGFAVSIGGGSDRVLAFSKIDADGFTRRPDIIVPGDALSVTDDPDSPPITGFARYVITSDVADYGSWVAFEAVRTTTSGGASPPVGTPVRITASLGGPDDLYLTQAVGDARYVRQLLTEAVWRVDAGAVAAGGGGLVDMSGNDRTALFTPGAEPVVLPHDGTDYIHIPSGGGHNVRIDVPGELAYTATRLDGTTATGTTLPDILRFNTPGDWVEVRTDDGQFIMRPSDVNTDLTRVANTGSAGGEWLIGRAETGLTTVVVNRPLVVFGGVEGWDTTDPVPGTGTRIRYQRTYGESGSFGPVVTSHDAGTADLSGVTGEVTGDAIFARMLTADEIARAAAELAGDLLVTTDQIADSAVTDAKIGGSLASLTPVVSDPAIGRLVIAGVDMGDSGVRDVSGGLVNGWTATDFAVQRRGAFVSVYWFGLDGTGSTDPVFYTLPAGFRPTRGRRHLVDGSSSTAPFIVTIDNSGVMSMDDPSGVTGGRAEIISTTAEVWPTTLPGTLVTP